MTALDKPLPRLLRAWLFASITDGLFSSVLSAFFYGSTVSRLWQGVAATVMGASAVDGGAVPVAVGIALHFGVALTWATVLLVAYQQSARLRAMATSPAGLLTVAVVYGPMVWLTMSLAVIPLLTGRPMAITVRWWIQFFGHMVFVALPMIVGVRATRVTRSAAT